MPPKLSYSLLAVVLAGLVIFGTVAGIRYITADHDGWDIFAPVDATTDQLQVQPQSLLPRETRQTLNNLVGEGRQYGIPWSMVVIEAEDGATAQELADTRFEERPVETEEGAGDGLLMLVAVPEDRTETEIAFTAGDNFYPRGGLTPDRLAEIVEVQMSQAISEDRLGDALIEGATWVQWTHLFAQAPETDATLLERGLQDLIEPLAGYALGALAALLVLAALATALFTRQDSTAVPDAAALDGLRVAAIERGRVDGPVRAGLVLEAIARDVLAIAPDGAVIPGSASPGSDLDRQLRDFVARRPVTPDALTGAMDRDATLAHRLEDELASSGALSPKAPILTVWVRWAAIGGLLLGIVGIVIAVLGSATATLGGALALVIVGLAVALWNERRSWATTAGQRAAAAWQEQHPDAATAQRAVFDAVVAWEPRAAARPARARRDAGALQLFPDTP